MKAKSNSLPTRRYAPHPDHWARGFTIIELVTVIVLIGVLTVVVLPRMSNSGLDERLFLDQTRAALRFAQKTAIASHRTVCTVFASNQLAFRISSNYGAANCSTGSDLLGPDGAALLIVAKGSAVYSPTPTDFVFDAKGGVAATQTITVLGMGSLSVEAETGYVH